MGRIDYKLPDIGEGIAEAEIVKWHVDCGAAVREDAPLVDVMTDKATVEIAAPVTGILSERRCGEGDKLAVGAILAVFETEGAAAAAATIPAAKPAAEATLAPRTSAQCTAAPAVRARARALGLDLANISGSGAGGRIVHADLDRLLLARGGQAPVQQEAEEIPVTGLRRRIAERMQDAKRRIPHFTYVEEVAVDALEESRARRNAKGGEHLTVLAFVIRALVQALGDYPDINSHFDGDLIRRFRPVHVGIATQTDRGLMVPVLRHAEGLELEAIASSIRRLSGEARAGTASRQDLTGSTITVTSLGALGGIMASPIINPPEVAIIGINRIREKLVLSGGAPCVRRVMNLSSSFDHRIVDGFVAASFIAALKAALESPESL